MVYSGGLPTHDPKEEERMKQLKNRFLSALLVLCMVLAMLPAGVIAADGATELPAITAVTANAKATVWPEGETQPGNITYMIPSVVFPDMNSPMETTFHMEISGLNPDEVYIIRLNHETEEYSTLSPNENGVVALAYTAPTNAAVDGKITLTADLYLRGQWDSSLQEYIKDVVYETATVTATLGNRDDYPLTSKELIAATIPLSTALDGSLSLEFYLPGNYELASYFVQNRGSWSVSLVKDGVDYTAKYGSNEPRCNDARFNDPRFTDLFQLEDYSYLHETEAWRIYNYAVLARPLVAGNYDAVFRDNATGAVLATVKDVIRAVDAPVVTGIDSYPKLFGHLPGDDTAYLQLGLIGGDPADYELQLYWDNTLVGTSNAHRVVRAELGETQTVFAIPLKDGAVLENSSMYTAKVRRKDGAACFGQTESQIYISSRNYTVLEAFFTTHYYANAVMKVLGGEGKTMRFTLSKWGEELCTIYATGGKDGWFDLVFTDEQGEVLPLELWTDYDIDVEARNEYSGEWQHRYTAYLDTRGAEEFSLDTVLASRETLEVEFRSARFDFEDGAVNVTLQFPLETSLTDKDAFSLVLIGVDGTEYGPIALTGTVRDSNYRRFSLSAELPASVPVAHYFATVLYNGVELLTANGERLFYADDPDPWPNQYTKLPGGNTYSDFWLGLQFLIGGEVFNGKYTTAPAVDFYPIAADTMTPVASVNLEGGWAELTKADLAAMQPGTRYYIVFRDGSKAIAAYNETSYILDSQTISSMNEQFYTTGTYPTGVITVDSTMENGTVEVLSPFGKEASETPLYSEVYLKVTPAQGYELVPGSLQVNGQPILGRGFLFTGNCTVTAQFRVPAKPVYAIIPNTSWVTHGYLEADLLEAEEGQTVTVTVGAESGYMLSLDEDPYYLIGADEATKTYMTPVEGRNNTFTFVMPAAEVELFARFVKIPTHYIRNRMGEEEMARFTSLTWLVDYEEAAMEGKFLYDIPMGDTVCFKYTITPGWTVDEIYATGHTTGETYYLNENTSGDTHYWYLDRMPNENLNLYMTFRQLQQYSISVDAAITGGSLTADMTVAYEDQWVTGTWTAQPGWAPDWIYYMDSSGYKRGINQREDGTFEFRMPDYDVTLGANFRELPAQGPGGTVTNAQELYAALGGAPGVILDGSVVKLEKDVTLLAPVTFTAGTTALDVNGHGLYHAIDTEEETGVLIVSDAADFTLANSIFGEGGVCANDDKYDASCAPIHAVWVRGGTFRMPGAQLVGQWAETTGLRETHAALRVSAGNVILGTDSKDGEGPGIRAMGAADAICISGGHVEILSGEFYAEANYYSEEEEAAGKEEGLPESMQSAQSGAALHMFKTGSVTVRGGWFWSDNATGNALLVRDKATVNVLGGEFSTDYGDAAVKIESAEAAVALHKAYIWNTERKNSLIVPQGKTLADYLAEGVCAWKSLDDSVQLTEEELQRSSAPQELVVDTPVEITVNFVNGTGTWELPGGAARPDFWFDIAFYPQFGTQVKEAWYMGGDTQYWIGWDSHYVTEAVAKHSKLEFTIVLEPIERHEGLYNSNTLPLLSSSWYLSTNMHVTGGNPTYTVGTLTDLSGSTVLFSQESRGSFNDLRLMNPGDLQPGTYRLYMKTVNSWGTHELGWDYVELTDDQPYDAWTKGQVGMNETSFTARLNLPATPITAIPEGLTLQLWDMSQERMVTQSKSYSLQWLGDKASDKAADRNGSVLDFTFTLKSGMLSRWSDYALIPVADGVRFTTGEISRFQVTDAPTYFGGSLDPETLVWNGTFLNVPDGTYSTNFSSEATGWATVPGPALTIVNGSATLTFVEAPFDLELGGSASFFFEVPGYGSCGFDVTYWPETGSKDLGSKLYVENAAWVNVTSDPFFFDYALLPQRDSEGVLLPLDLQLSAPGLAGVAGIWKVSNGDLVIGEGPVNDLGAFTATVRDYVTDEIYQAELYVGGSVVASTSIHIAAGRYLGADPAVSGQAKNGKFTVYPMGFSAAELATLTVGVRYMGGTLDLPFTENADGSLTLDVSGVPVGEWTVLAHYTDDFSGRQNSVDFTEEGWTIRIRPTAGASVKVKPLTVTEENGAYTAPVEYEGTPASAVTMTVFRLTGNELTFETAVNIGLGAYTVDSKALNLSGSYVLAFSLADGTCLGAHAVNFGKPADLTVTFVDWNGAVIATQTVPFGKDAVEPEFKPNREGWIFTGWNVSLRAIRKDTVITAVYTSNTLTVRFFDDQGINEALTQAVPYGACAEAPKVIPQREGYNFLGWGASPEATKSWDFDKPLTASVIFYALWEKQPSELTIAEGSDKYLSFMGYDHSKATWQLECFDPMLLKGIEALYENGIRQTILFDEKSWLFHVPDLGEDVTVSALLKPEDVRFTLYVTAPEGVPYTAEFRSVTDSSLPGHYTNGMGTGNVQMWLTPDIYTVRITATHPTGITEQTEVVHVSADSLTASVTVQAPVIITGTVTGAGEKAMLEFYGSNGWFNVYADEKGNFQLPGILPGQYSVYCYDGYRYVTLTQSTVTITPETTHIALSVLPSANVLVTLFTPETHPAQQVCVTLERKNGEYWNWANSVLTGGEGGTVALLEDAITQPGTYRVRVDYMTDDRGFGLGFECPAWEFTVGDTLEDNYTAELVYSYPAQGSRSDLTGEGNLVALDRGTVFAGEFVNLTVRYRNNGRAALSNVSFTAELPEGVVLFDDTQSLTHTAAMLVPGQSGSFTLTLKVTEEGDEIRKIPVTVAVGSQAGHFGDGLLSVAQLTLTGPSTANEWQEITLSGEAAPGSVILIKELNSGATLASTQATGRYYSAAVNVTAEMFKDDVARFVAVCEGHTSRILSVKRAKEMTPAVRTVSMNGEKLSFNKKLGTYTAWQYVDLDMRGYSTDLDITFNEDELGGNRILSVKVDFCGLAFTAKKDGGVWSAWLAGWGGSGLKTVTAIVITADGTEHRIPVACVNLLIDPSGIITDESGAPLEGVTVTCLQLVDGVWTVWNAEDYGQVNPMVTGADGKYGFMVPEGTYRIVATKEGFEDYDSLSDENFSQNGDSTVIIPPPRTDVDFTMVAKLLNIFPTVSEGGSASADLATAKVGQTVTVTLAPDAGYRITGVSIVTAGGKSVSADLDGETATFLMPADSVTVRGIFASQAEPSVSVEIQSGTAVITTENLHVDAIVYVAFYTADGQFLSAETREAAPAMEVAMGEAGMIRIFLLDDGNALRPLSLAAMDLA